MNLKDEVCSVEYAIRLKELGVIKEAPFQWVETPSTYSIDSNLVKTITSTEIKLVFGRYATLEGGIINNWAAYTVGQLFDLLPAFIDTKKDEPFNFFNFHLVKKTSTNIQYIVNYYCDTHKFEQEGDPFFAVQLFQANIYDEKLADALAKLLIALYEQGYVKNES